MTARWVLANLLVFGLSAPALAHVGGVDVFHEGAAGPYRLLVTVRPPQAVPGLAEVEIQAPGQPLTAVSIVRLPLTGEGADRARPDVTNSLPGQPPTFVGQLRLTDPGAWQLRVRADGPSGTGTISVPVPAVALRSTSVERAIGIALFGLLALLFAGLISVVGRRKQGSDRPSVTGDGKPRRNRRAQTVTATIAAAVLLGGATWWSAEARFYQRWIYKSLHMTAVVTGETAGRQELSLHLFDPGWVPTRRLDDLVPDHGHLMHLFAVRLPDMDAIAHLHPTQQAPGRFTRALPTLAPGTYQLFADVVHRTGLAETATATLALPDGGGPPSGDDSVGDGPPLRDADPSRVIAVARDGTRVVWQRDGRPLVAGVTTRFQFRVEDREGGPVGDLTPYMGMAGHALFVKHDRTVVAHVHPTGSVSMATLSLLGGDGAPAADPHAGHAGHAPSLPPEVSFPFACPQPGRYRVFVQVKRSTTVHTALFDADVEAADPTNRGGR